MVFELGVDGNIDAGTYMGFSGPNGFSGVRSGDNKLIIDDQPVGEGLFSIPENTIIRFVVSLGYFNLFVEQNQPFLSVPYESLIDDPSGYRITVGNTVTSGGRASFSMFSFDELDWAVGQLQLNPVLPVRGPYSSVRMIVTAVTNLRSIYVDGSWTLSELRFLSPTDGRGIAYDMVLADGDGSEIR